VAHTCHSSYSGSTNRRIVVQARAGIKRDRISKNNQSKRAGDVAQVAEQLSSKREALNSNPIWQKRKRERKKKD
jgi:hypothetical protein